ncbi:MAG: nucleotidyltransferase domain-containing protein [Defluviitaleaceae bacterium]|nr:nucleotidyltransferase domain-containing protein [Defluviitaleaceae bacterium]
MQTEFVVDSSVEIFKRYPIKRAAIFGSYAREEQTTSSDIDFVVELDEGICDEYFELYDELEEFFGVKVDILTMYSLDRAKPTDKLMNNIKQDLRWIYAR